MSNEKINEAASLMSRELKRVKKRTGSKKEGNGKRMSEVLDPKTTDLIIGSRKSEVVKKRQSKNS